jgi:hypothetical protein
VVERRGDESGPSARWPALLVALAVACSAPPGSGDDAPFDWQVALSELDDALLAVCRGGDRLIAVGGTSSSAAIYERAAAGWTARPGPAGAGLLWWCWVDDDGSAVAVGEGATVLTSARAGDWRRAAVPLDPDVTLYGVWGDASGSLWAVGGSLAPGGDRGVVVTSDGGAWRRIDDAAIPDEVLFKAWSDGAGTLWVVGTGGTLLRRDGAGWDAQAVPTGDRLIAVWGTGPGDVYAVGGDGAGLILRYDGGSWTVFDRPPVRLSGVWTAPGRPLYVAGDRGFVGRYGLAPGGRIAADRGTSGTALATVDLHALSAIGDTVVAVGADLVGGGGDRWRGALVTHDGELGGPVDRPPLADAGPVDAGLPDGAPADAGPAPGPGEACAPPPDNCAPGIECWGLVESDEFLCTERCTDAGDCTDPGYGDSPCCAIPGFQTLQTVCIPGDRIECQ